MEILVEPIWSWPVVVLAVVGLTALVLMTYPQRVRHLPPLYRRSLLGLRLLAVLALSLAMLRPTLEITEEDSQTGAFFVLGDSSRSMQTEDAPGSLSRRRALLKTLSESEKQLEALQEEEIDVRYFDFAEELNPVDEPAEEAEGDQTAIGSVLESLLKETQSQNMLGVVLLSDGAQRALPPHDVEPRAMARRFGELQIPVYTIGYGTSTLSESSLDLAVEDLLVDSLVFEKKTVPVNVRVRALGAAGRKMTVRLLVEDRTGKEPGESGEMKVPAAVSNTRPSIQIETQRNADVIPVELSYVPQQPGEYKIAVEVVPLEGELKQANNRRETIITVQKGGIKVAYFHTLPNEQKHIRRINSSEKIQVDFQLVLSGKLRNRTRIEGSWFEPDAYDAYIIGDVPADVFGPELLDRLSRRVNEGAGLMMTGGFRSFSSGGYAETPLADILPVRLNSFEAQAEGDVSTDQHYLRDLQMVPTDRGLDHYVMRIASPGNNRERWEELPPLEGANKLAKSHELVEVLAQTPDGIPLLFAHEVGQARLLAFAGDSTWLWAMQGYADVHQRFWRQVILWLTKKEKEGDERVWAQVEPRNYAPSSTVQLEYGARTEEGAPIPDADYRVEVSGPGGEEHQLSVRKTEEHGYSEFLETEAPGDYWMRVSAEKDGESLGFDAYTRFIVDSRDLEMDNPAADHALLEELSALSGGSHMPPEQLGSFLNRLLSNRVAQEDWTNVRRVPLWDNWPFLLVFVGIMTLEWFFRKRRGLV